MVGAVEGGGGPVEGVEEVGYDDEDAGDAADALLRKSAINGKREGREREGRYVGPLNIALWRGGGGFPYDIGSWCRRGLDVAVHGRRHLAMSSG